MSVNIFVGSLVAPELACDAIVNASNPHRTQQEHRDVVGEPHMGARQRLHHALDRRVVALGDGEDSPPRRVRSEAVGDHEEALRR